MTGGKTKLNAPTDDDYHFSFSNDNRTLKFSVFNDGFRAIRFQIDAVREMNLTGGLRKINELFLVDLFELTTIKWPTLPTHIRRLSIGDARNLKKLDLLALPELEELTIINCPQLEDILGIGPNIKKINIEGSPLATVKVPVSTALEIFNVVSLSAAFKIDLHNAERLSLFSLDLPHAQSDQGSPIACNIAGCINLTTVMIQTQPTSANIDLSGNEKLRAIYIDCGPDSHIKSLPDVSACEFNYLKMGTSDPVLSKNSNFTDSLRKIKNMFSDYKESAFKFTEHPEDIETILQQRGARKENNRKEMALIHIMGVPEQTFRPLPRVENIELKSQETRQEENRIKEESRLKIIIPALEKQRKKFALALYNPAINAVIIDGINTISESIFIPSGAVALNQDENNLPAWLENSANNIPNLLVLTNADLKKPVIQKLIPRVLSNSASFEHNNKLYPITPIHKILFIGHIPSHVLNRFGKNLFAAPNIVKVTLIPFKAANLNTYIKGLIKNAIPNVSDNSLAIYQRLIAQTYLRLGSYHPNRLSITRIDDVVNHFANELIHTPESVPDTTGIYEKPDKKPRPDNEPDTTGVYEKPDKKPRPDDEPDTTGVYEKPGKKPRPDDEPDTTGVYEKPGKKPRPDDEPDTTGVYEKPDKKPRPDDEPDTTGAYEKPGKKSRPDDEPDTTGVYENKPKKSRSDDEPDTTGVYEDRPKKSRPDDEPETTGVYEERPKKSRPDENRKTSVAPEKQKNNHRKSISGVTLESPSETFTQSKPAFFSSPAKESKTELEDDSELGDLRELAPDEPEHDLDELIKYIEVHYDKSPTSSNKAPGDTQPLLNAAKELAMKIGRLVSTAKATSSKPDDEHSLLAAAKKLALAINSLEKTIHPVASDENALYKACLVELIDPADVSPVEKEKMVAELKGVFNETSLSSGNDNLTDNFRTRTQIEEVLLKIRNDYIKGMTRKGVFGSAFQIGLARQRLEIVNNMLHTVRNHRQINPAELQLILNELKKDKNVANRLKHVEEQLKYYICVQPTLDKPIAKSPEKKRDK